jgi:glutathione S-transferase
MVIPDSDLILDLFEKPTANFGSISLCPTECQSQIQQWRTILNKKLIPTGKKSVLSGRSMTKELKEVLGELDSMVVGPYLVGDVISTADCHAFPFLWRLNDEYGLDNFPNLHQWVIKCTSQHSFQVTVQSSWWW